MNTRELQDLIIKEKKERDVCILAHAYQSHDIWEVADFVGDSYGLAVKAARGESVEDVDTGSKWYNAENIDYLGSSVKVLSDCVHPSEGVGFRKIANMIYNYLGI